MIFLRISSSPSVEMALMRSASLRWKFARLLSNAILWCSSYLHGSRYRNFWIIGSSFLRIDVGSSAAGISAGSVAASRDHGPSSSEMSIPKMASLLESRPSQVA